MANSPVERAGVDCHRLAIPLSKLSEKYGLSPRGVVVVVPAVVVVLVVVPAVVVVLVVGVVVVVVLVVGVVVVVLVVGVVVVVAVVVVNEVVVLPVVVDVAAEISAVGSDVARAEPFLLLAATDTRNVVPTSDAARS
ncbi:MAG: hypothetical protein H0W90_05425 [Actinobacteria bacterium]|nr:hypothetical protein [Actinomycetota bacterium]